MHTHSKITSPHLTWSVHVESPSESPIVTALVDTGSPLVLIQDDVVQRLQLHRRTLHKAVPLGNTFNDGGVEAKEWVKLTVSTPDRPWTAISVRAVIVPLLCAPIILGTPFFSKNHILVDIVNEALWHPESGCNLTVPLPSTPRKNELTTVRKKCEMKRECPFLEVWLNRAAYSDFARKFQMDVAIPYPPIPALQSLPAYKEDSTLSPFEMCIAAVRQRVEELAEQEVLRREDLTMKDQFADCFPEDIPHLNSLPTDVWHDILLKDASKTIV